MGAILFNLIQTLEIFFFFLFLFLIILELISLIALSCQSCSSFLLWKRSLCDAGSALSV